MKKLAPIFFRQKKSIQKLDELNEKIETQEKLFQEVISYIESMKEGEFDLEILKNLDANHMEHGLTKALIDMGEKINSLNEQETKRKWATEGLAQFSETLRTSNDDLYEISDQIIRQLVKYLKANQGALFVIDHESESDPFLKLVACYAYSRKKFLHKKVDLGEGLNGQVALEKETIHLTEIPKDFVDITSGLGKATPNAILIVPIQSDNKILGTIELATFSSFELHQIEFVEKLGESIASTIYNIQNASHTKKLLIENQEKAEIVQAQEEELRQNLEEMEATQESLGRKNKELEAFSIESKSILHAINTTMATIEFTPQGEILDANDNFLKTVGYTLHQIQGKHHRLFVSKIEQESESYRLFWEKLSLGEPFTGTFKRIDAKGETIWLNAIYNPMLDADGEVAKVVKFATDITAQQKLISENQEKAEELQTQEEELRQNLIEMEASQETISRKNKELEDFSLQSKGILDSINATMATIEFTPKGEIIDANENFLKTMGYSLEQIKGNHHKMFVSKKEQAKESYKVFWETLEKGNPFTGTFQRINASGETVWLNAIYNPIFDIHGNTTKVVKFATDISEQQKLIIENQEKTEELQSQEEELRQNLEEMEASQETISRKNMELEKFTLQSRSILNAINATMATIEFTPKGEIIEANENFLKTMGYSLEQIKGNHHRMFVSKDEQESNSYKRFWETLEKGKPFTGTFKRINANGPWWPF